MKSHWKKIIIFFFAVWDAYNLWKEKWWEIHFDFLLHLGSLSLYMYIQHDVDICPCMILDGLCKIASQEGLSALWNGTAASIILASNPSIQFMVYETIKRYFQQFFKSKASTTISIYCSSCSIQSRFTSISWYLIHASYFLFSNK